MGSGFWSNIKVVSEVLRTFDSDLMAYIKFISRVSLTLTEVTRHQGLLDDELCPDGGSCHEREDDSQAFRLESTTATGAFREFPMLKI